MIPTGDGIGGELAHIWLLPAKEQVDEQPADMVAAAKLMMLGRVSREEGKRTLDMSVSLLAE